MTNRVLSLYKEIKKWVGLSVWIALPIFLLVKPATYFNEGRDMCPSKIILDMECFGCGLTRGVMHTIHFKFMDAWHFNKLSWVVTVLLIMVWIHVFGRIIGKRYLWFMRSWY